MVFLLLLFQSCITDSSINEPAVKLLTDETIAKLQSAADKVVIHTPGLIAYIIKDGEKEVLIKRGVSNLATNEPVDEKNFFRIASITKSFTTEAVLILADKQLIDLNKTISFYLPEYNIPGSDKITVRMLGNMTSGLVSFTADTTFYKQLYNLRGEWVFCAPELIYYASKYPLKFTPGSKYEYCNTNTVILGEIIKKVTSKSVSQVLTEEIFLPLGMKNTSWPSSRYLPAPYSHGYSANVGSLIDVTNWNPSFADAAGILIANFEDLKIWTKEINQMKLLSTSSKAERRGWIDEDPNNNSGQNYYGFGLMRFRDWIGHSGVIEGYNSQVYYNTVKDVMIIVNTNTQDNNPAEGALHLFADIIDNQ
jgi:D-alanyl-D-alanine carboxypeptidase